MRLEGSIALVTGANRGLGRRFVEALVTRGAQKVYAGARALESLDPLVSSHGGRVVPLALDVTNSGAIADAAATASDVTLLINNAGVLESRGLVEAGSLEPLRREMAVNVFGLAEMCLSFAPVLAANGGGAIANMLSVASLNCFPPFGSYSATKAAAMSLTRCLRYELKGQGIDVFGIYAGLIETDMTGYIEAPKTAPEAIIAAAIDGLEGGIPDIDTDERSRTVRAALCDDPARLEAETWDYADRFRADHPLPQDR